MKLFSLCGVLVCILAIQVLGGQIANPPSREGLPVSPGLQAPEWAKTLPKDVYPESGNRLPLPKRDELPDYAQWRYDEIARDPGSAAAFGHADPQRLHMVGPRMLELYSPFLAEYTIGEVRYLHDRAGIPPRLAELIILVTARGLDDQFQWAEHAILGREKGLQQSVMDVVKDRKPLTGLGEEDATIIQMGREIFGQRKLSSDTFARALKLFGQKGLVNIVSLMRYYAGQHVLLTVFDQHLRPERKAEMPIP